MRWCDGRGRLLLTGAAERDSLRAELEAMRAKLNALGAAHP